MKLLPGALWTSPTFLNQVLQIETQFSPQIVLKKNIGN